MKNRDEHVDHPSEPVEISQSWARFGFIKADRVDAKEIDAAVLRLQIEVPRVWQLFLTEIGITYLGDMLPYHPSTWAESQPDHEDLRSRDDTLPAGMLAVGSNLSGDWCSLDLANASDDGDCGLLKFDHEIDRCVDSWPSVRELINDELLGDCEQA